MKSLFRITAIIWHMLSLHENKYPGSKSMSHIAIDARVLLKGMACILISHTLLFPMPLCALGVLLWSTRMPFVSDSFQRGKQCHILWQCNEHGLLLLPHRLLKKKRNFWISVGMFTCTFSTLAASQKFIKEKKGEHYSPYTVQYLHIHVVLPKFSAVHMLHVYVYVDIRHTSNNILY